MKYFISIILTLSFCSCGLISTEYYPSLKQYYQEGIPLVEKDWTPQEYLTTTQILISKCGLSLPNQENSSIKIIEKITDIEIIKNLNTFDNDEEHLFFLDQLIDNLNDLLRIYGSCVNTKKGKLKYSYETVSLAIATFHIMETQLKSSRMNDMNKKELEYVQENTKEIIQYGFNSIQKSYIFYNEEDFCLYSKALFKFYQKNKNYISKTAQEEFDHQLSTMKYSHRRQCVKEYAKEIVVKK